MFRSAFADDYEAVTGQKYCAAKPLLTTKEAVREEADNLQEAWKDRALNKLVGGGDSNPPPPA